MTPGEANPYNPLEKIHLAESIARALESTPVHSLPPDPFSGAGIYAIYYRGSFAPYDALNDGMPIYVGSALPEGGQTGMDLEAAATRKLYQRLAQHARSIEAAQNLELADFVCRYLVVDPVWIPLAEHYLISRYRPVWNSGVLRGFGIHDPGRGRAAQRRSLWDELHPGRAHATDRPSAELTREEILEGARDYIQGAVANASDELDDPLE